MKNYWLTSAFVLAAANVLLAQPFFDASRLEKFPTYRKVVETYFLENQYVRENSYTIFFAKKYDGWYVLEKNEQGKTIGERLIWSFDREGFTNLRDPLAEIGSEASALEAHNTYLSSGVARFFDSFPMYGYAGWYDDVIELLQGVEGLPAPLLDALARSYSEKAHDVILKGQYDGVYVFLEFDSTFDASSLSENLLKSYTQTQDKAIAIFDQLSTQFPDYQTVVGNIRIKYYNEYLTTFYNLSMLGQDELAQRYLPDSLYDAFTIETAKNYLRSCLPNAVLLTTGDNDTYPLVYVQEKFNFRQDVAIININLANLGRYIHYVKKKYKIATTLDMTYFQKNTNDYFLVKEVLPSLELGQFFEWIQTDNDTVFDRTANPKRLILPTFEISLPINPKNLDRQLNESRRWDEAEVVFSVNRPYFFKADLFLLDLLHTNAWLRPVYTTPNNDFVARFSLHKNMTCEGLAMRFLPSGANPIKRLSDNLLTQFTYLPFDKKNAQNPENQLFTHHYLWAFIKLANYYQQTNDGDQLQQTLAKMTKIFPLETTRYGSTALLAATLYYGLEMPNDGDLFLQKCVDEIHIFFQKLDEQPFSAFDHPTQQEIRLHLDLANRAIEISDENGRIGFADLDAAFAPYFIRF